MLTGNSCHRTLRKKKFVDVAGDHRGICELSTGLYYTTRQLLQGREESVPQRKDQGAAVSECKILYSTGAYLLLSRACCQYTTSTSLPRITNANGFPLFSRESCTSLNRPK